MPTTVTTVLQARPPNEPPDVDRIYPEVYDTLRILARRQLGKSRGRPTLDTTSLVHEAYLRLADQSQLSWKDKAHFLAIASRAMRFVIVDYVRRRTADKRGGEQSPLSLDPKRVGKEPPRIGALLDLNDALEQLETIDERAARVVECRFFGGLTVKETAEALQCSPRTVKRDWRKARLLLYRRIHPRTASEDE